MCASFLQDIGIIPKEPTLPAPPELPEPIPQATAKPPPPQELGAGQAERLKDPNDPTTSGEVVGTDTQAKRQKRQRLGIKKEGAQDVPTASTPSSPQGGINTGAAVV